MFQRITMCVLAQNVSKKNTAFSWVFKSFTTFSFRSILSVSFVRGALNFAAWLDMLWWEKSVLFNVNCFLHVRLQSLFWMKFYATRWMTPNILVWWTETRFWMSAKAVEFGLAAQAKSMIHALFPSPYTFPLFPFINIVIGNMNYLVLMLRLLQITISDGATGMFRHSKATSGWCVMYFSRRTAATTTTIIITKQYPVYLSLWCTYTGRESERIQHLLTHTHSLVACKPLNIHERNG